MPAVKPIEYPPPFDSADVIGPPTDPVDDRIEVGIAIVGGGPAGLACANKLMQLLEDEPELTEKLGEVPVAVIEKGKVAGAHLLSGANVDPRPRRLFPDMDPVDWPPVYQEVTKDGLPSDPEGGAPLKSTTRPPPLNSATTAPSPRSPSWAASADEAEEAGVYILAETAATKLLVEDRIVGARSGDRGRGKDGEELGNFEPGSDVVAKATVLAEGTIGHLTLRAYDYFDLHGSDLQAGSSGRGDLGGGAARSCHPHPRLAAALEPATKEAGGSFIYPMGEDKVCSASSSASTTPTPTFSVMCSSSSSTSSPDHRRAASGSAARRRFRRRLLGAAEAVVPGRRCGDAAGMVNIAELLHPLCHARRDVRGGSDRRAAQKASTRSTSKPTTRRSAAR